MNSGWIKIHRKIRDNELLMYDLTALAVFVHLLTLVDRNTGNYRRGRFALAKDCGDINPNTLKDVIKRLKKAKIITTTSTNKFTTYHICNWSKYQQLDTNKTPTKHQQNTTRTRTRELRNINTSRIAAATRPLYEFYLTAFNQTEARYKLTAARKLKLQARLKDAGEELLKQAITATAASPFHRGDNDRGWKADLDYIIRSYEQVEKLAALEPKQKVISTKREIYAAPKQVQQTPQEYAQARKKATEVRQKLLEKFSI